MACVFPRPADLPHALPRPTLDDHAVRGPVCRGRSGGLGIANRGSGGEGRERRAAVDGARGRIGVRRRGGVLQRESVRRPAAARQAGAGHRRPWRLQLRRPEYGCAELLPLRRSGGRNRRPRDTALGSVDSKTLPDADRAGQERLTAWSWVCISVVACSLQDSLSRIRPAIRSTRTSINSLMRIALTYRDWRSSHANTVTTRG